MAIIMDTVGRMAVAMAMAMAMATDMGARAAHLRTEIKQSRRMARVVRVMLVMAVIRIASAPERPYSPTLAPYHVAVARDDAHGKAVFRVSALIVATSLCYVHSGLIIT
jgi:hypothetical protein